jgi:hypothetical protein
MKFPILPCMVLCLNSLAIGIPVARAQQTAETVSPQQSATQKWLAQVGAQFQETYEKTILAPYKEGLEAARKAYQSAIETALQNASGAGQEQEAGILRAERERFFSAGRMVPSEPASAPSVQEARAKFRAAVAALDKTRLEKARPLHARFDAALAQNIPLLKQRQLLADAALLTAKREEIARDWLQPGAGTGPETKEEKAAPISHMALKDSVQWMLDSGAKLRIVSGKKTVPLRDVRQLPSGHPEFTAVALRKPEKSTGAEQGSPDIQDRDLDRLAPLRGAKELVLAGYPFTDSAFGFLDVWKELEEILISGAQVSEKLAAKLARFPMLRSVGVVRSEKVNGDFVRQLSTALPKLEELRLMQTDVGDQSVNDLLAFKRLSSLDLRGTRLTDQGLARLAGLKTLRELDVADTKVTAAGLGCLASLKLASLGFLSTDSPSFADDVAQLAKVLPKLEGITLSGSEFRLEHAEALTAFRELRLLSIKDAAPKAGAFEPLQKIKNLEDFSCNSAGFGDDEIGMMAELKHLHRLNVSYTSVTNAGLQKLAKNKELKNVSATGTPITESGVDTLEKAVRGIRVVH